MIEFDTKKRIEANWYCAKLPKQQGVNLIEKTLIWSGSLAEAAALLINETVFKLQKRPRGKYYFKCYC